jgi:hypothetical protein
METVTATTEKQDNPTEAESQLEFVRQHAEGSKGNHKIMCPSCMKVMLKSDAHKHTATHSEKVLLVLVLLFAQDCM